MTAKYYLSDLHLGHQNITKFRSQFSSMEEHDSIIKDNYHKVVRPKDHVTIAGDVAFSPEALYDLKNWNGIKSISLGNHDNAEFKKRGVSLAMLQEVFEDRIFGFYRQHEFWISHCPIHRDELRGRFNLHGHCVDLETEILTTTGWKFRKDLTSDCLIYSFNKTNNQLEIKPLIEIIDIDYSGTVYHFKTKSLSQRVTSEHTMIGLVGKNNIYTEISAENLANRSVFKYILNSIYTNKGIELSDDLLELYIAINADGSVNNPNNLIRFFFKKSRKINYIISLLKKLSIPYRVYTKNCRTSINFSLPKELLEWNLKGLDNKLLNCNQNQFKIILKAYSNTDGTQYKTYSTVYTSKKQECDLLSHLATINGYTSTTSIRYQHGFSKKTSYEMYFRNTSTSLSHTVNLSTEIEQVVKEPFWCIKTELQNFFIRRNGKVSLTGNCHGHVMNDPRYLNICMEHIDYTPISLERIRAEFLARKSLIEAISNEQ